MPLKKSLFAAALLLAAALLAGCSIFATTPPADGQHGAVEFSVDLAELDDEGIVVGGAGVVLVQSATILDHELTVAGGQASGLIEAVPVGTWQATIELFNGQGESLASRQLDIAVQRNKTTAVALVARVASGQVRLDVAAQEPGDGAPGQGEPGPGQPGDDEPGDGNPGDGEPGGGDPGDGEPGEPGDGEPGAPPTVTREVRYIQSGNRTETRTAVYIIRSSNPGPTAFLVGGMHGSETSGWIVAGEVAQTWSIDRGTLVVIPEANKDAVRRQRRTGRDGRDLNRYFPEGRDISDPKRDWLLAKEIWDVVLEFEPVALLDLHEGWGLREAGDRFPGGTLSVGQTVIVYPAGDAMEFAEHVIEVLNTQHNPFYGVAGLTYNFRIIGPPVAGSLARKAGADLGIPAFIFEPTQGRAGRHQTTVAQRSHWQRVMVEEFLRWYGLLD
ncbi:MAG: succinylglutamate desuccinylase/aspartoacylase family protein [Limnochordales bacterium]